MNITLSSNDCFSFVEMIISSFLGFGSALLVEYLCGRKQDKRKAKEIQSGLIKELKNILDIIDNLDFDKTYICPYTFPIWNGVKYSGSLQYIENIDEYHKLISVFSEIEEANLVEKECFEIWISGDSKNKDIMLSIVRFSRDKLKSDIENIL